MSWSLGFLALRCLLQVVLLRSRSQESNSVCGGPAVHLDIDAAGFDGLVAEVNAQACAHALDQSHCLFEM